MPRRLVRDFQRSQVSRHFPYIDFLEDLIFVTNDEYTSYMAALCRNLNLTSPRSCGLLTGRPAHTSKR